MKPVQVRFRSEIMEAWQYMPGTPVIKWPGWVVQNTRYTASGLVVDRTTGLQLVSPGDWLVRRLDHMDLVWYDDKAFHQELEII